jgi:hypothetical protein
MDEGVLSSATDSGPLNIWFSGPFFLRYGGMATTARPALDGGLSIAHLTPGHDGRPRYAPGQK